MFVREVGNFVLPREFLAGWQVRATGNNADPADGLSLETHSSIPAQVSLNPSKARQRVCVTASARVFLCLFCLQP